ncbi:MULTISPECIES: hypothetical protein [Fischerella]|nr:MULTISPECIES: hypothetical protein [Fischerella]
MKNKTNTVLKSSYANGGNLRTLREAYERVYKLFNSARRWMMGLLLS